MDKRLHNHIFDHGDCVSEPVLLDYAHDKLPTAEKNKVEKHLLDCELCSDALEGLMLIKNPNSLPKIKADVVRRFGPEEIKKGRIVKLEFRTGLAIAASIAVLVVTVFFFRSTLKEEKTVADVMTNTNEEAEKTIATENQPALIPEELKTDQPTSLPPPSTTINSFGTTANRVDAISGEGSTAGAAPILDEANLKEAAKKRDIPYDNDKEDEMRISTADSKTNREENQFESPTPLKPALSKNKDSDIPKGEDDALEEEEEQNYRALKTTPSGKSAEASKKKVNKSASSNDEPAAAPEAQSISTETLDSEIAMDEAAGKANSTQDEVFMIVEEMPSYPGGEIEMQKFLKTNIKYPAKAQDAGIQGTVYINFIVEKDGMLSNIKVVRGISGSPEFTDEAIRVVRLMPKWKAGKQNNTTVKVSYTLPIKFSLNSEIKK